VHRRILIAALLALMALALATPSGASAEVGGLSYGGGMLSVFGSNHVDTSTIRFKLNGQGQLVVEIYDPGGVSILPEGCTRKDANTIQCPGGELFSIVYAGEADNDEIYMDLPLLFGSFLTTSPTQTQITVDGGPGNDTMAGIGPFNETFIGGPGNDTQMGGGGNDVLNGGPGNDKQFGQAGNDTQNGGPGNDKEIGGTGNDKIVCGGGDDKVNGGGGKDKAKGCEEGKA
jgi:Ca2+-binding RTX toxin-like protein